MSIIERTILAILMLIMAGVVAWIVATIDISSFRKKKGAKFDTN